MWGGSGTPDKPVSVMGMLVIISSYLHDCPRYPLIMQLREAHLQLSTLESAFRFSISHAAMFHGFRLAALLESRALTVGEVSSGSAGQDLSYA